MSSFDTSVPALRGSVMVSLDAPGPHTHLSRLPPDWLRQVNAAALPVLSVAAVAELRSWPAQRLFGVDAGGGDASASILVVARAHSALPALTPAFSEAPARSFSCCKNGRDDTPMSWWPHLENRFGMPFPPAVVLSARACAMQWLNSVYSSTPDQQGGVQFSL